MTTTTPRIAVDGVTKIFQRRGMFGAAPGVAAVALDDVSLTVARGESFGVVGESGSGKSTLARCILRLLDVSSGQLLYDGESITDAHGEALRGYRRRVQAVLQDASGSLDPRMTVGQLIVEPLTIHRVGDRTTRAKKAHALLGAVGLPADFVRRRPRALSGGQRQRVGIARALALDPETILLDEPVSALDVSVQAQVLNLLKDLQETRQLTYLFIVHDLAVAKFFCDRIAVLYRGRIMETGSARALLRQPGHPYTRSLIEATPTRRQRSSNREKSAPLANDERPAMAGCVFRQRCPIGRDREICRSETPPSVEMAPGHTVACHFPDGT